MKLPKQFLLLCLVTIILFGSSSFIDLRNDQITFTGTFGKEPLVQNKKYFCAAKGDSISVSVCRFYISKVELMAGDLVMGTFDYKLIDLFDSTSRSFRVPFYSHYDITSIRFQLGIDSATNVAGVGGGDLDPTRGMYWSWQSGYINLKLEGSSNLCVKNKNEFQYHLGGYAAPNNALRTVELKVHDTGDFVVNIDVEQFFSRTDMATLSHVMSPSLKAVELSAHAANMFDIRE
ncbi:MAG TPA: MbnP family protein [Bacteroidia bacterium]|nr:MbnP family protein [Bacteroidia bacterium]